VKHVVCKQSELGPGQMRTVTKGRAPVIVVCSNDNEYYAVRGICPHQGAMLDRGHLTSLTVSEEPGLYALTKGGEILRCPWHSFDYDVTSGECVSDQSLRIKTYPVYIEEGDVVVDL
jgi:nitrite reductase (NADH) small subunit